MAKQNGGKTVQATYTGRGTLHDPVTDTRWFRGETHEISRDDFARLLAAGVGLESGDEPDTGKADDATAAPVVSEPAAAGEGE